MKNQHAKSLCCKAHVHKHGRRRRICSHCGSSWTIRSKKRGRKRRRVSISLASRYLDRRIASLRLYANDRGVNREKLRRYFRKSLDALIRSATWEPIPPRGQLIAVADAFVEFFAGREYTIYIILIKQVGMERAVILPPLIQIGHENDSGWRKAFSAIPPLVRLRIMALASDGKQEIRRIALNYGWLHQRCQFHLKARLGRYISYGRLSRSGIFGFLTHQAVNFLLTTTNPRIFWTSFAIILHLIPLIRSKMARLILRAFLRYVHEYRTYLYFPHLGIPETSNSAEAVVHSVRNMLHQTRGFRSPVAFELWITIVLQRMKTISCRSKSHRINVS